jgi:hypothetical protein
LLETSNYDLDLHTDGKTLPGVFNLWKKVNDLSELCAKEGCHVVTTKLCKYSSTLFPDFPFLQFQSPAVTAV